MQGWDAQHTPISLINNYYNQTQWLSHNPKLLTVKSGLIPVHIYCVTIPQSVLCSGELYVIPHLHHAPCCLMLFPCVNDAACVTFSHSPSASTFCLLLTAATDPLLIILNELICDESYALGLIETCSFILFIMPSNFNCNPQTPGSTR